MIRIVLIRHGQTAWNEGAGQERFRGRIDLPLDPVGLAQAQALAVRLKGEPIAALYTSPLLRARQTIAPLAHELRPRGVPLQAHDGLLDIDYGHFQGLTFAEAAAAYPEVWAEWQAAPGRVRFPGGEALADVRSRFVALLDELAARHPGQTVALLGHQRVNQVAACTLLGIDLDRVRLIRQDPCALDIFEQVDGLWHTHLLNDTCHLG